MSVPGPPPGGPPRPPGPPPGAPGEPGRSGDVPPERAVSVGQILGGILLILIVVFIIENTESVKIRFIVGPKVSMPVFVALLVAAVVGALVAALLRYRRRRHHGEK